MKGYNVLELFAGSRSIGKVCDKAGLNCFSVDKELYEKINLQKDIEFLEPSDIPFIPDLGWASPLCTTYSIAAISHHRNGILPKSELAVKSDRVIITTIKLFKYYESINANFKWFIENPVGMLRKMPFMKQFDRATIYYCRYGDTRMKPTDIWTNDLYNMFNITGWKPRRKCWKGNKKCHHEPTPRSSTTTGTESLKNSYEKSIIPQEFAIELISHYATQHRLSETNKQIIRR